MVTREKLASLMEMLGCKYRGGRAESAPMTRTTSTGKTTIAEAEARTIEVHAIMPHPAYSSKDLNDKYPPMMVNQDVSEDDEARWSTWDGVAQRGDDIIREVLARKTRDGRRRCEA
jgi:hypothetical protein